MLCSWDKNDLNNSKERERKSLCYLICAYVARLKAI